MVRRTVLLTCCVLLVRISLLSQVTLTDDLGRAVTLDNPPRHIVSLAPSITETLFAIRAGEHIAGVTDYCNHPEAAKRKQRVGGIINPSIETIVSLQPDLILLSMEGNVREDFERLTSLNVPVFVSNPRNLAGVYRSINQLGMLTGRNDAAEELVATLRHRADSVVALARTQQQTRLLLIVSLQPLIVTGKGSFLSELITLAGGQNIAGSLTATFPTYSREAVVAENPDVIILVSGMGDAASNLISLYPEWSRLNAVKNGRVVQIEADLIARPGPRVVEGLEILHRSIHQSQRKEQ